MSDSLDLSMLTWAGIFLCLSQAAILSGLNLAVFSVSRLRLEIEAKLGNPHAVEVLGLRKNPNHTLTTILWSNVAVNVLLTLLSDSVLAGISAFFFSTFAITLIGEILPQAYFSRHALAIASAMTPLLRIYGIIFYPLARATAAFLDRWLGREGVPLFREHQMRELIRTHIEAEETEIDRLEGLGALNFLALDDLRVSQEGEIIDPDSVISLEIEGGLPQFPEIKCESSDPFLQRIDRSGRKWIIITDPAGEPAFAMNSDAFLRDALFSPKTFTPLSHCHRPIIVRDVRKRLGSVIRLLKVEPTHPTDNVIDHDVILVWNRDKRVITGADILGRLLSGITTVAE